MLLDGVYVRDTDGKLAFHALPTPTSDEVLEIARRTAKRLHRAFRKRGRPSPWDDPDFADAEQEPFSLEQPGPPRCRGGRARRQKGR